MAGLSTEDPTAEEEDDDLDRESGRLLRARTCLDRWSRLDMAWWMPSALWRHERERERERKRERGREREIVRAA